MVKIPECINPPVYNKSPKFRLETRDLLCQITPCAIIARATFIKPAMFAPFM